MYDENDDLPNMIHMKTTVTGTVLVGVVLDKRWHVRIFVLVVRARRERKAVKAGIIIYPGKAGEDTYS